MIEIACTVTQHNQAHRYETAEIADALGVDHFKLEFQVFSTQEMQLRTEDRFEASFGIQPDFGTGYQVQVGSVDPALIRSQEESFRRRDWQFEYGHRPRLGIPGFDPELHLFAPEVVFGKGYGHNLWARAVVLPDGEMVVCQGLQDYKLGNIRNRPFHDLRNGKATRRSRKSLTEDGLFPYCSRCCELYEMDEYTGPIDWERKRTQIETSRCCRPWSAHQSPWNPRWRSHRLPYSILGEPQNQCPTCQ